MIRRFERWATSQGYDVSELEDNGVRYYISHATDNAWVGWQAAESQFENRGYDEWFDKPYYLRND